MFYDSCVCTIHIHKHRMTYFSFFHQSVLLNLLDSDSTVKFQVHNSQIFFIGKEKTLECDHLYQIFFICTINVIVNIKPEIQNYLENKYKKKTF